MFQTRLFDWLEKSMDGSVRQHAVIGNNIANVNTPGFKKSVDSFRDELEKSLEPAKELKTTNSKHLQGNSSLCGEDCIKVTRVTNTSLRNDGNNVDIDMELAALAENNLYFNSLAQLLSSQLALLRHSISEGRR